MNGENFRELLRDRLNRLERAMLGKKPDRVPFWLLPMANFVPRRVGITVHEYLFNYSKFVEATLRVAAELNVEGLDLFNAIPGLEMFLLTVALVEHPDVGNPIRLITGPMHDILQDRYTRWPGRELSPNAHPQFLGGTFMEVDEYKKLADDLISFLNEVILPRVFKALEKPTAPEAYSAWVRLGIDLAKYGATLVQLGGEMAKLGYPSLPMGWGYSPLDFISDFLRHPTRAMIDLRRVPDDVKNACEALTPHIIKVVKQSTIPPNIAQKQFGITVSLTFFPLHLNEMLSLKLYNEFYWPYLKKVLIETINIGAIPFVAFEGDHTPHLETIIELPKGKVIGWFERADLRKVREILGDHIIIAGGISSSLLIHGTPEKVFEEKTAARCKRVWRLYIHGKR
ncbi:MAG: hypothetical protein DRJ44_07050 [Thermoprotei archaeon]|nr:MAG: hypothetical protein DRJ44_07050 [Thermoprotei archaeon]